MTVKLPHNIKERISLKEYTTFKIGGLARYFVEVDDLRRLEGILKWARNNQQKIFILGGGSNLLFMDDGFDGLIIKMANNNLKINIRGDQAEILCGAGTKLSKLVAQSFKYNITGLEWAVGIPGTVGGAVRGNAGAFGGEMKDIVSEVKILNLKSCELEKITNFESVVHPNELTKDVGNNCKNIVQTISNKSCNFNYRKSLFKDNTCLVVWGVKFLLKIGDGDKSKKIAEGYLQKRKLKQPEVTKFPSAGSVFKNPVVNDEIQEKFKYDTGVEAKNNKVPAGWLVSRCGLLGKKIGGAMVSKEHGNFIINIGKATSEDVLMLISIIKTLVRNKYEVHLQEEICVVH